MLLCVVFGYECGSVLRRKRSTAVDCCVPHAAGFEGWNYVLFPVCVSVLLYAVFGCWILCVRCVFVFIRVRRYGCVFRVLSVVFFGTIPLLLLCRL